MHGSNFRARWVFISHNKERNLNTGDILVIYRIGETLPKKYSSTVTTICIVENVISNIKSSDELIKICRKRTVLTDEELKTKFWNKFPTYKPFVINILYAYSFPKRPTLGDLNEMGIIPDISNMQQGFIKITNDQFRSLLQKAYRK